MGVTAVVPLKALDQAKSRLASGLDAGRRRALMVAMAHRVLSACRAAPAIDDLLVVAGDRAGAAFARQFAARVLLQPRPGLAAALDTADAATATAPATLVLVADLPLITAADVAAVCAAGRTGPCAVVAPTEDGGTGALLRRPGRVFPTAFGRDSASAHVAAAHAAGVPVQRLWRPGLAHDVDTLAQLRGVAVADASLAKWLMDPAPPAPSPPEFLRQAAHQDHEEEVMPQGTVKAFDRDTNTGTILLDNADELPLDAATFAASGLLELRLGQRVRFEIEGDDADRQVRRLNLVSL